jgi:hypothetical protein
MMSEWEAREQELLGRIEGLEAALHGCAECARLIAALQLAIQERDDARYQLGWSKPNGTPEQPFYRNIRAERAEAALHQMTAERDQQVNQGSMGGHVEVDLLTPLQRFIQRSRVKPTDGQIAHALGVLDQLRQHLRQAEADRAALQTAAETILTTFTNDEAQGYRSRDRQFAIELLSAVLARHPQERP